METVSFDLSKIRERVKQYCTPERYAQFLAEETAKKAEDHRRLLGRAKQWGFPVDKVDLILSGGFKETEKPWAQLWDNKQVVEWIANGAQYPYKWFFVSANPGTGKGCLITKMGMSLIERGFRVRYMKFSGMLDECKKVPDLLAGGWDFYAIDDFWKGQWISQKNTQEYALELIDALYSYGKGVLIGCDKPIGKTDTEPGSLKSILLPEVRAQVIGRIRERTERGRYVLAVDGVDLR